MRRVEILGLDDHVIRIHSLASVADYEESTIKRPRLLLK